MHLPYVKNLVVIFCINNDLFFCFEECKTNNTTPGTVPAYLDTKGVIPTQMLFVRDSAIKHSTDNAISNRLDLGGCGKDVAYSLPRGMRQISICVCY